VVPLRRGGDRRLIVREATPALKPWPYYRAVDLWQRARIGVRPRSRTAEAEPPGGVRILAYHRVADARDPLAVGPATFRAHMEALLEAGLRVLRLDDALDVLSRPVGEHCVCVTFDDGYRDTLEHAAPVLQELGIPATVFLPTAIIDGAGGFDWYRRAPPPPLSWDEVGALIAGGLIDVQSHSRTHPRLPALDDAEAREELVASKADIERRVPYSVSSFCYPAGLYSPRDARLVLEAGYRAAVTCRAGVNRGGEGLVELRRTLVGWGVDAARFRALMAGRLDQPSRLTEAMQRRRAAS
jgi:peptidoglycan/xylan/chitin deacetylase (PgdA/CDA1 family)